MYVKNNIEPNKLYECAIPEGTDTWTPLPHLQFFEHIESEAYDQGFDFEDTKIELCDGLMNKEVVKDARLFVQTQLVPHEALTRQRFMDSNYNPMLGARNANDQLFAASAALGDKVPVCSNLMWGTDMVVSRKHTGNVIHDWRQVVSEGFSMLKEEMYGRFNELNKMKEVYVSDKRFADMLVKGVERQIISPPKMLKVKEQWDAPKHEEFEGRNVYSAMNAFTEVFKEYNHQSVQPRTIKLNALCGELVNA